MSAPTRTSPLPRQVSGGPQIGDAQGDAPLRTHRPTRVLFLVPDLWGYGGIARFSRLVCKAISEAGSGWHLDVYSLCDPGRSVPDPAYLAPERSRYFPFDGNRARFARAVVWAQVQTAYDVVLVGHVNFGALCTLALRRPRPWRATFLYGIDAWHRLPWHRRWPLLQSDQVMCISQYTAGRAGHANGLSAPRVRILRLCLDPALDAPRVMGGPRASRPPIILTVSRLALSESSKGHEVVIRALPAILRVVPDAEYHVVGRGDLRPHLERVAQEVGVGARVRFLGYLSDEDLLREYAQATVFAMPSLKEGFGLVFLEALVHGVPVVAGNKDAASEVLGDQEGGLLVDPEDVEAVAGALTRLLSDDALHERLGQAGRARVDRLFRFPRFQLTLLSYLAEAAPPA